MEHHIHSELVEVVAPGVIGRRPAVEAHGQVASTTVAREAQEACCKRLEDLFAVHTPDAYCSSAPRIFVAHAILSLLTLFLVVALPLSLVPIFPSREYNHTEAVLHIYACHMAGPPVLSPSPSRDPCTPPFLALLAPFLSPYLAHLDVACD